MEVNPVLLLLAVLVIAMAMFFLPRSQIKPLLTVSLLVIISYFLIITVAEMPSFGSAQSPAHNEVAERYLQEGVMDTGIPNSVSSIILDYRAIDTLGEATVIFIAIAAVVATIKAH